MLMIPQNLSWITLQKNKFILGNTEKEQESDLAKGTKQEMCSNYSAHLRSRIFIGYCLTEHVIIC